MSKIAGMCLVIVILAAVCGCQETQSVRWGQGELPPNYQKLFGSDNKARLDYAQTNLINQQQSILYGIDAKDPNNEQVIHKQGLIERVEKLEEQNER